MITNLPTGCHYHPHQPNRTIPMTDEDGHTLLRLKHTGSTIPMSNNNEQKEWKAETKCSPLGDTGDYNTWVELSNGEICLFTEEAEEEELQEIADKLNALSGIPDPEQWVADMKRAAVERDILLSQVKAIKKELNGVRGKVKFSQTECRIDDFVAQPLIKLSEIQ